MTLDEGTSRAIEDVVVAMFHLRDPRGGRGRVRLFQRLLLELWGRQPDLAMTILSLVPEYGSWDDMFSMAMSMPQFKHVILSLAEKQLVEEEIKLATGQPLSMFAKWVPDEKKAMGALAVEFAYRIMRNVPAVHSQIMGVYRKRINRLNAVVNPVEIYECAGKYDEIDPTMVSEGALRIKKAAYLNQTLGTTIQRSSDPRRIKAAVKFQEFYDNREKPVYDTLSPDAQRYDAVRAVVREWVQGGWRV